MDYKDPDWVAEKLGLERNTVYRLLHDGTLPAIQLGRKWLISEARLHQWLEEETDRQTRARREGEQAAARTSRRMETFTAEAQAAIRAAHSAARGYNHHYLGQEHLLLGLAMNPQSPATRALSSLGLTIDVLRSEVESRLQPGETVPPKRLGRDPSARKAMRIAEHQTRDAGERHVSDTRLLRGILESDEGLGREILLARGITLEQLTKTENTNV